MLVVAGLVLEVPVRWVVRPHVHDLVPGNPWFDLPLRLGIEAGFVLFMLVVAFVGKIPLPAMGIPFRKWTRWEWGALGIVGAIQLAVVVSIAGARWPQIFSAGLAGQGLAWALGEFLFGVNQETGFRGLLMTGILKLKGFAWATILNTLLFWIGPLHGGAHLLVHIERNPVGFAWLSAGVIVSSLFFSWLRYRTDNVILAGILHGIVNGFLNGATLVLRAQG